MSRVDTSADDIRKDAMAVINDYVEKLRGYGVSAESEEEADLKAKIKSESVAVLSSLAELCREEGAAGEANRMAVGVVCVKNRRMYCLKFEHAPHVFVSVCVRGKGV